MIIVSGEIELENEATDQMRSAARTMMAATRLESGCISYAFYQALENPRVYRVFEEWESQEHLKAHFQAPHMANWRAALAQIGVARRNIKWYDIAAANSL